MKHEKSCGAIVFRKSTNIKYLLLYRAPHENFKSLWDFPRGNVEEGENEKQAAIREIKEETGITDLKFYNFKSSFQFFYKFKGELIKKYVIYLLAETSRQDVKLSHEHQNYKWATFEEALELLTHENSKESLRKAHEFLQARKKQKTLF
ncbi:MAG: NUDIX domain-containing protein [Candidatus Pacearchaeota archaeon]